MTTKFSDREDVKDIEADIRDEEQVLENDFEALVIAISHVNNSIAILRKDYEKLRELSKLEN